MNFKHKLLLSANKIILKNPLMSFDKKMKIHRRIMNELRSSGFRGV